MVLALRRTVINSMLINAAVVALLGLALIGLTIGTRAGWPGLVLLLLGSLIWGGMAGRRTLRAMAQGIIAPIPQAISYAQIGRQQQFGAVAIDWHQLDDYAAQLEAQGFVHLGDFTSWPISTNLTGVALMYGNRTGNILVEIQFLQLSAESEAANGSKANGIHFSIVSILGGQIRVVTTDHTLSGPHFVLRSSNDVLATHPGENLMSLLERHGRLVQAVCQRTGKRVTPGLSVARQVLFMRERYNWVRARLSQLGHWQLISEIDRFEANPVNQWALPSAQLATLQDRTFEVLEQDLALNEVPVIVDLRDDEPISATLPEQHGTASATSAIAAQGGQVTDANQAGQADQANQADQEAIDEQELALFRSGVTALLTRSVSRNAAWFYWIAGLSVINLVAQANASTFSFSLGLGLVHTLFGQAEKMLISGASGGAVLVMYLGCVLAIGLMIACGRFAKKPSVFVFAVGMGFYALDAVVFMLKGDTVGVLIHVLALYFLYRGARAARALRVLQALPTPTHGVYSHALYWQSAS